MQGKCASPQILSPQRERMALFDDPEIPKFLYGSHYSTLGAVLFYLIRMEPFTSHALTLQVTRKVTAVTLPPSPRLCNPER